MKKILLLLFFQISAFSLYAQINTDRVMAIGRNALYFEDYVLSIQYFNQVIRSKPWMAEPYYYRAVAKLNLDDFKGAEEDCTLCLERNSFYVQAYFARAISYHSLDKFDEAIADYKKALSLRPDEKAMLSNLSIAYVQKKDYDKAEETLDYLIRIYPKGVNHYLSRAALFVEKGDTIRAFEDYDKAIEIDPYYSSSYGSRAILYYQQGKYKESLADYNEAIQLDPFNSGFYINRGLVRYNLNDLRGAMADYDRVIQTNSDNLIARFNRGLLRFQVGDNNRAIEDFDVVLKLEPNNYMAYYNRALGNMEVGNYRGAIADYSVVLDEYPSFIPGYYARSEAKRKMGDVRGADVDYWAAIDIEERMRKERQAKGGSELLAQNDKSGESNDSEDKGSEENTREQSDQNIEKFNRLVVSDAKATQKSKYNSEIRGRVQDKDVAVDLEPQFILSYYEQSQDVRHAIYYDKSLEDFNDRKPLNYKVLVTNKEAPLTERQVQMHFESINEYSGKIASDPSNADYYFGRGMDYMLVQDFAEAINDFTKAIEYNPNFSLAYFTRAALRYKQLEYVISSMQTSSDMYDLQVGHSANAGGFKINAVPNAKNQQALDNQFKEAKLSMEHEQIMRDYDMVISLNSGFVYAYFNRGNIRCIQKDYRAAIQDYNEAILRDNEFAEAYFNRGLAKLSMGDADGGVADLSKAGELGIISAYNIIKRMTNSMGR